MIDWPLERDLERSFAAAGDTRRRIAPFVRHTPLLDVDSPGQHRRLLKLESLQHTGSFKIRGAASAITAGSRPRELVAASTGNHGLAVAALAAKLGIPCRVYVAAGAARAKLTRLREAGVELVECDGDPLNAELAARKAAGQAEGALLVAPYNDPHVVLGAATLGLELLDDLAGDPPDALFVAVGGGGLISGTALAVRGRWPDCRIVGCLPEASPAMADAVAAGQIADSRLLPTLADATAGNLEPGSITVAICAALVDEFVLVGEAEIAAAMRAALIDHHIAIEGAAAVALAASLGDHPTRGARTERVRHVVVVGGGNVGSDTLFEIL